MGQEQLSVTTAIQARSLAKSYGRQPALKDLDLTLNWGESLTVLGPNGSGKSTLIKLLSTLVRPTSGNLTEAGIDPQRNVTRLRSLIGVVTHESLLYEELTGKENLEYYGRIYGVDNLQSRIEKLTQALALTQHIHARVRTLSHGLRKRISLARALLHRPCLLFLDEPETGLDQEALGLLNQVLKDHLAAGGCSVVATHDVQGDILLGSQVAILVKGRFAYQGSSKSLDSNKLHSLYRQVTGGTQ